MHDTRTQRPQTVSTGPLLGALILMAGLASNTITFGLLAEDGEVSGLSTTLMVAAVQVALILVGTWMLARSSWSPPRARLLLLMSVALLAGGCLNLWGPVHIWRQLSLQRDVLSSIERSEDLIQWLTTRVPRLTDGALNLSLPDARSARMFADVVHVTDVIGSPTVNSSDASLGGVAEQRHWPIGPEPHPRTGDELRIWQPFFATVAYFEHAGFKIVRGEFVTEGRFETDVDFEAVAKLLSGETAQVHGKIHVAWGDHTQPDDEDATWLVHGWHTKALDVILAERPIFAEVLDRALPDPDTRRRARQSLHEQLVLNSTLDETYPLPEWFTREASDRHPGLAVVDIDQDGFDDVYVMARWGRNLMLRNQGDGTFEDIAADIGLDIEDHSSSAIFADFDNDGDADVMLGRTLASSMYLSNEQGHYVDRSATAVDGPLPSLVSSIAAADYDADGLLDVYFSTYSARMHMPMVDKLRRQEPSDSVSFPFLSEEDSAGFYERCTTGDMHTFRDSPGPPNLLLRNTGRGFVVAACNEDTQVWRHTFQSTFADYDGDGDADIYAANDFAPNNLLRNDGGRFVDVTEATGSADIGFGMGATWGDYDNDGAQDLYVTNMFSKAGRRITARIAALDPRLTQLARGNSLLHNEGERFKKVSGMQAPALLVEKVGWSWGAQFLDFDNDGYLDLYAPSGYYTAPEQVQVPIDL
jgi:hypothetical protein